MSARKRRLRIVGFEQRPVLAALDAPHQHVELGFEPNRNALRADDRAGVGMHESAAARRQYLRPAFQQAAITRASPARKSDSPRMAKMSEMVMPAAFSISASASTNGMPSRSATRRPIDDLPAPIMPTSTAERRPSAATMAALSSGCAGNFMPRASRHGAAPCPPTVRLPPISGLCSSTTILQSSPAAQFALSA